MGSRASGETAGEVELVIGLEVHVQLLTKTKVFCGCPNKFNPDEPNTQTCPVCQGLPGALPVLNAEALDLSIRAGLGRSYHARPASTPMAVLNLW